MAAAGTAVAVAATPKAVASARSGSSIGSEGVDKGMLLRARCRIDKIANRQP